MKRLLCCDLQLLHKKLSKAIPAVRKRVRKDDHSRPDSPFNFLSVPLQLKVGENCPVGFSSHSRSSWSTSYTRQLSWTFLVWRSWALFLIQIAHINEPLPRLASGTKQSLAVLFLEYLPSEVTVVSRIHWVVNLAALPILRPSLSRWCGLASQHLPAECPCLGFKTSCVFVRLLIIIDQVAKRNKAASIGIEAGKWIKLPPLTVFFCVERDLWTLPGKMAAAAEFFRVENASHLSPVRVHHLTVVCVLLTHSAHDFKWISCWLFSNAEGGRRQMPIDLLPLGSSWRHDVVFVFFHPIMRCQWWSTFPHGVIWSPPPPLLESFLARSGFRFRVKMFRVSLGVWTRLCTLRDHASQMGTFSSKKLTKSSLGESVWTENCGSVSSDGPGARIIKIYALDGSDKGGPFLKLQARACAFLNGRGEE